MLKTDDSNGCRQKWSLSYTISLLAMATLVEAMGIGPT